MVQEIDLGDEKLTDNQQKALCKLEFSLNRKFKRLHSNI